MIRSFLRFPTVRSLSTLAVFLVTFALTTGVNQAGTYGPQAFTFANGTNNLGDGTTISSNDGIASVQSNALRLTASGTTSTASSFKLPDLDAAKEVQSFDVSFALRLFASGTPADGFSLNFGALPTDNGGGEGGFVMPNGLVIAWDTYNNGNDVPSIEVFANGISVGNFPQTFSFDGQYRNVVVHWDASGLDISYNGVAICTNLATPGFTPRSGNRFGYSARTGGATEDVYIDDLLINTAPSTPLETGGPVISEFVVANNQSYEDEDADSSDWIEIYNGQSSSVNLSGWTLTNVAGSNGLWTFPSVTIQPYSYLVVFASGKNRVIPTLPLHTNFTMQREAGYIGLIKPGGTEVASQYTYSEQAEDVSYGESGSLRTQGYMYPSTPGAKNTTNVAAGPPAEDVVFSRAGGIITGTVSLGISTPLAVGAVVRYTTNNTEPGPASTVYTAPFSVSNTTTVRARVYAPNRLPGKVSSRTFLRADTSLTNYNGSGQPFSTNLPIVVLDSFGVPVDSFTTAGNRSYRLTYGVVIPPDPTTGRATITDPPDFQGRSGTHVRGESSSGFPQKQYSWELWDDENNDKAAPLLGMPADSDWILYAPWSEKTLMRDVLVFGSMRKLRNDYMAARTKHCEVFFNQNGGTSFGYSLSYRGVYVIKERLKIDKERVNLAKVNNLTTQQPGVTGGYIFRQDKTDVDSNSWTTPSPYSIALQSYDPDFLNSQQLSYLQGYINSFQIALAGGNFANPDTGYAAYIDPGTFIDAQWFVEWTKQVDGYVFSTYYHKDRLGKMRAGPIWDFNIAIGNANYGSGNTPAGWLYDVANGVGQDWYPRLHQDPNYRMRHWDRYWELRRGILATDTILGEINSNASLLLNGSTTPVTNSMAAKPPLEENAVMRHYRKYPRLGQYDWPNPDGYANRIYYNSNGNATTGEVDYMKNWLQTRLTWIDDQNRVGSVVYRPPTFSANGGNVALGFQLAISAFSGLPPTGTTYATGTIYYTLDGSDPRTSTGTISPTAQAYTGLITLNASCTVKARLNNGSSWSPANTAVFVVDAVPASAANLVVSELHYQPVGPSTAEAAAGFSSANDFEYLELLNISSQNVDLSAVVVSYAVDFSFVNADPTTLTLPPGGRVILVENKAAFQFRYGISPTVKIAGAFAGNLGNGGELLTIRGLNNSLIAQFTWGDVEPWPVAADGDGYSLVLNNPAANPSYALGTSWRSSAQIGGAPGAADSTPYTGSLTADTDGDGMTDYLEYACGSNAANPSSVYPPSVAIGTFLVGGEYRQHLRFQYRRSLTAEGCTYTVLLSEDAVDWKGDASAVTYVGTANNGDGTATVTYRSTQSVDPAHPNVFMRLKVN
jgi:hypothetical protein